MLSHFNASQHSAQLAAKQTESVREQQQHQQQLRGGSADCITCHFSWIDDDDDDVQSQSLTLMRRALRIAKKFLLLFALSLFRARFATAQLLFAHLKAPNR